MTLYRQTLIVLLLTMLSTTTFAQNNTNSPYTRYGYGKLMEQGSGNTRAMGGIAYGLRDKSQTNVLNPASYTAVDSLTFIFDGGLSLQNTNFSDGTLKKNAKNSSFDYITMQFRASRRCAVSLGLLPFSNVGYNIGEYRTNNNSSNNSSTLTYSGEGGLHQVYLGTGVSVLKNLSLGINVSYLWGDITRSRYEQFPLNPSAFPMTDITTISVKSYKIDFGAQYTHRFDKDHSATLGVVFSPGHNLNNDADTQTQIGNSSTGATVSKRDTIATFGIPLSMGVGVTYMYANRLTVGMDATYQKWGSVKYMNDKGALSNAFKVALGAEYIPNPMGRSYLSHVKYRFGAFYSKPYYKIENVRAANEYGVTAGFGLPLPRTRSMLSISAQYVRTEGTQSNFLKENTLRIGIGLTFNERWFFKRKVD